MGLLDQFLAGGKKPRQAMMGLLQGDTSGFQDAINQLKQLGDPAYTSQIQPMNQEQAMNLGLDINPVMGGITAYHGSPYLFKQFDVSKSGTGSGKNLFGEGVYFSELPKEAKSYMTSGKSGLVSYNGKVMNRDAARNTKDAAVYALHLSGGNVDDAIRSGLSTPEQIAKIKYEKIKPEGYLYEVDIPDKLIPNMINYGEPIKKQNKNVINLADKNKESLNKLLEIERIKNPDAELSSIYDLSSSKLFRALGGVGKAEKQMMESGITGVRYNSPVEGMNTVVFDPSAVNILKRNNSLLD